MLISFHFKLHAEHTKNITKYNTLWNSKGTYPYIEMILKNQVFAKRKKKITHKLSSVHFKFQTTGELDKIISNIWLCKLPFVTSTPLEGKMALRPSWSAARSSGLPFRSVTWSYWVSIPNCGILKEKGTIAFFNA